MAKGSKSKKTKATKSKTKTKKTVKKIAIKKEIKKIDDIVKEKEKKKKTREKKEEPKSIKEEIKEVKEKIKTEIPKETKKEIKKEDKKEEKVVEKKEPKKKRKLGKKSKRKIIRLIVITLVLAVLLVILIIINKESYNKNTSFITKNNIQLSSPWSKFKAPIYSFAVDKKDNPVEVENLTFVDKKITYNFYDVKRDVLDDGDVLMTIPCDMEVELEYVIGDDIDTNWIYTYSYMPVFAFDYYSGDIYHEKNISDSKLILIDSEKDKKDDKKNKNKKNKEKPEDVMIFTDQVYNDKKITIGVLNNSTKSEWGSNIYQGNKDDGKHFKVDNKATTIIYIKAPKNYDGIALAINKNGANYDTWKKEYDYYEKTLLLQEEEKKTGEKSNELMAIEKEKEIVHKLLDKKDELRKSYTKDDFYVIRVTDMFKDDYLVKEESNINLLYITGILVLSLSVLTCIFMTIGERNKAYGKRGY